MGSYGFYFGECVSCDRKAIKLYNSFSYQSSLLMMLSHVRHIHCNNSALLFCSQQRLQLNCSSSFVLFWSVCNGMGGGLVEKNGDGVRFLFGQCAMGWDGMGWDGVGKKYLKKMEKPISQGSPGLAAHVSSISMAGLNRSIFRQLDNGGWDISMLHRIKGKHRSVDG